MCDTFQSLSPYSNSNKFENSLNQVMIAKVKEPKGKIFNSDNYSQYLIDMRDPKTRKNMLKNKQLLFKNH